MTQEEKLHIINKIMKVASNSLKELQTIPMKPQNAQGEEIEENKVEVTSEELSYKFYNLYTRLKVLGSIDCSLKDSAIIAVTMLEILEFPFEIQEEIIENLKSKEVGGKKW